MQFLDIKANKLYNFLNELPFRNKKAPPKSALDQFPWQYDSIYNFFFKGNQIKVEQIRRLHESSPNAERLIILKQKPLKDKEEEQIEVSYDSHRNTIEEYVKETKQNQTESIKQNAEFLFQHAIDSHFKYLSFDFYDLQNGFGQERKMSLLNEVFPQLCSDQSDSMEIIDWKEKEPEQKILTSNSKNQLKKIEERPEEHDESDKQLDHQCRLKNRQNPQKMHLQLHELTYITEQWRQIHSINKYLLKRNFDNPLYEEEIQTQQQPATQKEIKPLDNELQKIHLKEDKDFQI